MARQAVPRGQTAEAGTRNAAGKINMEAYEAYHNSKDNALLLSQTQSEELGNKGHEATQKNNQKVTPKVEEIKSNGEAVGKEEASGEGDATADGKKSPSTVTTNNYTTVM